MVKKLISIDEKDVVSGMVEVTAGAISLIYKKAIIVVSVIYFITLIATTIIIADVTHVILANGILIILYIFAILALKSYHLIQIAMINNITKLTNMEEVNDGPTNNGKRN